MRLIFTPCLLICLCGIGQAQPHLALTATPSASASSTGNFGRAKWTDDMRNTVFFGWVGTTNTFPQSAWRQLASMQPQSINRMVLHNAGSNFASSTERAVLFSGHTQLMYGNATNGQFLSISPRVSGYGGQITPNFPEITTAKVRLDSLSITGSHNPGFDEWQVYRIQNDTIDAQLDSIQIASLQGGIGRILRFSLLVSNRGNVNIVNPSISYSINTNPVSGPFTTTFPLTLAPGTDTLLVHPETQPAERVLNGRQLCAWVTAAGDAYLENDTSCKALTGIGTSVSDVSASRPQVYPNPLQHVLYFKQLPAGSVLRFYDAHGRCITQLTETIESFTIPQDWPAGLYLLQIQDKNMLQTIRLQRP